MRLMLLIQKSFRQGAGFELVSWSDLIFPWSESSLHSLLPFLGKQLYLLVTVIKEKKKWSTQFTWPSLYILNVSSQGYLCNLRKPLLHTAFHTSCSHSLSFQEYLYNTSEMVWRLTGLCSEMGLPAGAGLALNVNKSLLLLLFRRWKAWRVFLLPISLLLLSLPAIHRWHLLGISPVWESSGKVEEHVQVCLEEPQVGSKLTSATSTERLPWHQFLP